MPLSWKAAGGLAIGYVVLELVSVSIGTKVPELSASRADVVADFTTGSASKMYAGAYVTVLALLVFAAVAAFLVQALRETAAARWAVTTAFAAGVVYVTASGLDPALLAALVHSGHHGADAGALMLVNDVRNFTLDLGFLGLGGFTVAASIALLRANVLPRWIAYAGLVSGVLLFVPMAFGEAFLLNMVWMVAFGIVMASRRRDPAGTTPVHTSGVPAGV